MSTCCFVILQNYGVCVCVGRGGGHLLLPMYCMPVTLCASVKLVKKLLFSFIEPYS